MGVRFHGLFREIGRASAEPLCGGWFGGEIKERPGGVAGMWSVEFVDGNGADARSAD